LAYQDQKDWNALTESEQDALLAQDDVLRHCGSRRAGRNHSPRLGRLARHSHGPYAATSLPLAGFGIIEAADLNEAIELVAGTPCARAKGVVELRSIAVINI
jgi:hypothetical protein